MKYNNRAEIEHIGKTGAFSYETNIGNTAFAVSRQLSSFWLVSKRIDKGIAEHLKGDGFWESWITLWISRNVPPGSICIDAGANYGYFTFQLALHGCRVFAIEANAFLIPLLEESTRLNGCGDRVKIINKALADVSDKEINLTLMESSLNTTIAVGHNLPITRAVTLCLDDLCSEDFPKIDFVKMDIEGSEELAWRGMQKFLDRNPKCLCLIEFVPGHYAENGRLFFNELQRTCSIAYVDYSGNDQIIDDYSFFTHDSEPFRMLVVRKRL